MKKATSFPPVNQEAQKIVAKLGLVSLPREGGFYRLNWISAARLQSGRATASAIYFFVTPDEFSAFHRLAGEELWHFYSGDAVDHIQLNPETGAMTTTRLGGSILAGHVPQLPVPAGVWQGAKLAPGGIRGWTLLGCSLSPAWEEKEFEIADTGALLLAFPKHAAIVRELTR